MTGAPARRRRWASSLVPPGLTAPLPWAQRTFSWGQGDKEGRPQIPIPPWAPAEA